MALKQKDAFLILIIEFISILLNGPHRISNNKSVLLMLFLLDLVPNRIY